MNGTGRHTELGGDFNNGAVLVTDPFAHQRSLARQGPGVTVNLHGVSLW
jgi:hypothetical protein